MANFEDYQELEGLGYIGGGSGVQTAPEEEFFHSLYIAGTDRVNHINVEEKSGLLQVRGIEYNKTEVYMVITHIKDILARIQKVNGRDNISCFSYKNTSPWNGTAKLQNGNNRTCPTTSADRAINDFCKECRAQLIVSGIYCDSSGRPITADKKPLFLFIRGKATRYQPVSDYLNSLYKEEMPPITNQGPAFEKSVVNHKRFVTKVSIGSVKTKYNSSVKIFTLERGTELQADAVLKILKLSKDTVEKFNEKFDWTKSSKAAQSKPEGIMGFDSEPAREEKREEKLEDNTVSFDDIIM